MAITSLVDTMSTYFKNTIINHVLMGEGGSGSASGSQIYLALYNSTATQISLGISTDTPPYSVRELSGNGYSRLMVTGSWLVNSTTGSITNSDDFIFPVATADWSLRPTHMALLNDDSSSGSYLLFASLSSSPVIQEGDSFKINKETISIKFQSIYSTYLTGKIMEHYLNDVIYYTPGSSIFLAIYSASPSLVDTGGFEISGSVGYARIKVPTSACWVTPTNGSTANTVPITFEDSATETWGRLVSVGIRDHPTTGNLLLLGSIYPPVFIKTPDGFKFDTYALSIKPYVPTTTDYS